MWGRSHELQVEAPVTHGIALRVRGKIESQPEGEFMTDVSEKIEVHRGLKGVHFDRSAV
jgi:hypothetical protein